MNQGLFSASIFFAVIGIIVGSISGFLGYNLFGGDIKSLYKVTCSTTFLNKSNITETTASSLMFTSNSLKYSGPPNEQNLIYPPGMHDIHKWSKYSIPMAVITFPGAMVGITALLCASVGGISYCIMRRKGSDNKYGYVYFTGLVAALTWTALLTPFILLYFHLDSDTFRHKDELFAQVTGVQNITWVSSKHEKGATILLCQFLFSAFGLVFFVISSVLYIFAVLDINSMPSLPKELPWVSKKTPRNRSPPSRSLPPTKYTGDPYWEGREHEKGMKEEEKVTIDVEEDIGGAGL